MCTEGIEQLQRVQSCVNGEKKAFFSPRENAFPQLLHQETWAL